MGAVRTRILAALLVLLPGAAEAQIRWELRGPAEARQTGSFADRRLDESSGLAASRSLPGVLWTIEDSGNPADLHAVDTTGRTLGRWRIDGARNRDWEAISAGPCGRRTCLYIADTGDNSERRRSVSILRFPEPAATTGGRIRQVESLAFRYPDGAHDVESLVVTPAGDLILITKGRSGGVRAYRIRSGAWTAGRTAVAERIGSLPLSGEGLAGLVTDAALHSDGRSLVVRTYVSLHLFTLEEGGAIRAGSDPVGCSILGLELQGEGMTWLDGERLALSSEAAYGIPGTISLVRCPRE